MNCENKILNLFNNGFLRNKDLVDNNIPSVYLTRLVNNNVIERVSRGLYVRTNSLPDDLAILQNKSKNAIYSNMTALYLYGFSDRLPIKYDITVNSGYNGSLQEVDNVNLFYTKKELLNLGEFVYRLDSGNLIKVYDLERTICDVIKNKNRLDQELANKALRKYFYSKEKNTLKLYEYAEKMKIYKKVRSVFEILG